MDNVQYFLPKISNYMYFMSKHNVIKITKIIYNLHKENHGLMNYTFFKSIVSKRMKLWAKCNNINLVNPIQGTNVLQLNYINNKFINDSKDLYLKSNKEIDVNVYRSEIKIGHHVDKNNKVVVDKKKYKNMTADDIKNINVWKMQKTFIDNDIYRYSNTIPEWQTSIQMRHYDKHNEGLHHYESDRASLNNIIRGYNMKTIKKIYSKKV